MSPATSCRSHTCAGGLIVLDAGVRARAVDATRRRVPHHGGSLAPTMVNFLLQHPKIREYDLSSLTRHRLRRGRHAGRGVALRDRSFRAHRVVRVRDDRARAETCSRSRRRRTSGPSKATSTSWRRAARRWPGQRQGRRRRHERVPARSRRRDRDPGRASAEGVLAATRRARRRRSAAAGSTPATWRGATTRASSTSSTARRT